MMNSSNTLTTLVDIIFDSKVLQSAVKEIGRHEGDQYADDDLFDESLSDSNPDIDTISLQSVPKPKLRSVLVGQKHTSFNAHHFMLCPCFLSIVFHLLS